MNRLLLLLLIAVGLVTFLAGAAIVSLPLFFKLYWIPQSGMFPTLEEGVRVIAKRRPYKTIDQVERGDLVVWRYREGDQTYDQLWRVVGLPGDSVELSGTDLKINDTRLVHELVRVEGELEIFREQLASSAHHVAYDQDEVRDDLTVEVPEGHIFLLGDNRDHAADSRVYGPVPFEAVVGRVVWWPGA